MIRRFFALAIAIGLHTSLCTGGVFALATSATDALAYSSYESVPMSYGAIGYLSCENQNNEDSLSAVHLGCDQSETCFSQANSLVEDRTVVSVHAEIPLANVATELFDRSSDHTVATIKPPPKQHQYLAMSVVRRE